MYIDELFYEAALKERVDSYEELLYEMGYYDPDPCERQLMSKQYSLNQESLDFSRGRIQAGLCAEVTKRG
jgi:hypothetical protein